MTIVFTWDAMSSSAIKRIVLDDIDNLPSKPARGILAYCFSHLCAHSASPPDKVWQHLVAGYRNYRKELNDTAINEH